MSRLGTDEQLWYDGLLSAGRQYDSLHLFLICTISSRNIKHEVLTSKKHHVKFTRIFFSKTNYKSIFNIDKKRRGSKQIVVSKKLNLSTIRHV